MTWREFILRREGFFRERKNEETRQMKHTRVISYFTLVATGAIDTKKLSLDKFLPIKEGASKGNKIEDWQKEALLNAINGVVNESGGRIRGES